MSCENCEHLHGCRHQCMELPEGMTCGQCVHVYRCSSIFGCNPESTVCDFYPIRFQYHSPAGIIVSKLNQSTGG